MKVCKYCGNQMFDQAVMCTKCGCMCEKPKSNSQNFWGLVSTIIFLLGQVAMLLLFMLAKLVTKETYDVQRTSNNEWGVIPKVEKVDFFKIASEDSVGEFLLIAVMAMMMAYGTLVAIRSFKISKNLWVARLTLLVISGIQTIIIAYWAFGAKTEETTTVLGKELTETYRTAPVFLTLFFIVLVLLVMSAISFAFTKKDNKKI